MEITTCYSKVEILKIKTHHSTKFSDKNGVTKNGGICKRMANVHSFFKPNNSGDLQKFREDIETYKFKRSKWGWGDAHFAGFAKFDNVTQEDFQFGFGCSNVMESKPNQDRVEFVSHDVVDLIGLALSRFYQVMFF